MENNSPIKDLSSTINICSICLDEARATCDRTIVTLKCSHVFHLDCIGSAFNAVKSMRCPNCLRVENGTWNTFDESESSESSENESSESDSEEEGNNLEEGRAAVYILWAGNNYGNAAESRREQEPRGRGNNVPDLNLPAPEEADRNSDD